MKRRLTKWHSLRTLLDAGLDIGTVIDIGVQRDSEDLRSLFPHHRHLLFEPVVEYLPAIEQNYRGMAYEVANIALTDRNGPFFLDDVRYDDGGVVSHVQPARQVGAATRSVEGRTLDHVLHHLWKDGRIAAKPYLVKIDVDGHEAEVMRGAKDALALTACLIVETTLDRLTERCALAERAGLYLWDIVDLSFYRGCLYQVDLVFVSRIALARYPQIDPVRSIGCDGVIAEWWYGHQADGG